MQLLESQASSTNKDILFEAANHIKALLMAVLKEWSTSFAKICTCTMILTLGVMKSRLMCCGMVRTGTSFLCH